MGILIYPAIDLRDGKCVRLVKGDFGHETVYNASPGGQAVSFAEAGARQLHVVDLDGARSGKLVNGAAIREITHVTGLPVQCGGGVRSFEDIEERLALGVARVIIGSKAITDFEFVKEAVNRYHEKIAVGVDALGGKAAGEAWSEVSGTSALDLVERLVGIGVETIIYTDISKDGTMEGPNFSETKRVVGVAGKRVILSGGVSRPQDVKEARDIGCGGVIVGSAVYKGTVDLRKAVKDYEI